MDTAGALIGFIVGAVAAIVLWFPLWFAPVAMFGDINAEMPGWAIAGSIWWYFLGGIIGAVVGGRYY